LSSGKIGDEKIGGMGEWGNGMEILFCAIRSTVLVM